MHIKSENRDRYAYKRLIPSAKGIVSGIFVLVIFLVAKQFPETSDLIYRRIIFQIFRFCWDYTIGLLPFPLVYLFVIWLVWKIYKTIRRKETRKEYLLLPFSFIGRAFSAFMWMWGFNYACSDFKQIDSGTSLNEIELYHFGEQVVEAIHNYEESALKNLPDQSGYSPDITFAVETYLHSNGWLTNGNVKCVETGGNGLLRKLGAAGIYLPYTGQGHCDATYPDHVKLMIKAHETAHGYGITDEGEADYVAFMSLWQSTPTNTTDSATVKAFKYSALLSLLRTIRTELIRIDDSLRIKLDQKTSWNIRKEMMAIRINSLAYPSFYPELSTGMNDVYLKTMGVREGVGSYDQFLLRTWLSWNEGSIKFQ